MHAQILFRWTRILLQNFRGDASYLKPDVWDQHIWAPVIRSVRGDIILKNLQEQFSHSLAAEIFASLRGTAVLGPGVVESCNQLEKIHKTLMILVYSYRINNCRRLYLSLHLALPGFLRCKFSFIFLLSFITFSSLFFYLF